MLILDEGTSPTLAAACGPPVRFGRDAEVERFAGK